MTRNEVMELLWKAKTYWLSGWWLLETPYLCSQECNGMGADWMPGWIRKVLSGLFAKFAPAFAIHDMRYFWNKGERDIWDDELELNCRKIIRYHYSEWNPMRYIGYGAARRIRMVLLAGGKIAWDQCSAEQKGDQCHDDNP